MASPESIQPTFWYGPAPSRNDTEITYDDIIVGSGAAGAVVASALVSCGRKVLMIERGPFVGPGARDSVEGMVAADSAYFLHESPADLTGRPWTTCNVGGGTMFYAGVAFRPREVDFTASKHYPGADLPINWPFGYQVLRPFFDAIQLVQGISGGEGDPLSPGGDAPALPALALTPQGELLHDAAARMGVISFQTPLAVLSRQLNGRSPCTSEWACDERACAVGAKGDAYNVFLRPLFANSRFKILTGLNAIELVPTAPDRVGKIRCTSRLTGESIMFTGERFFIACNAIQSSALLLRSSGVCGGISALPVGRGLCMKQSRYIRGMGTRDYGAHRGPHSSFATMDYYIHPDAPYGMGGLIYEVHPPELDKPGSITLELLAADTPQSQNRVAISSTVSTDGTNLLIIHYRPHHDDLTRLDWMESVAKELLQSAGATEIETFDGDSDRGSAHLHGTCRAGTNPCYSVVDAGGRLHGLDNVFVADGGYMPFPTGVNPTFTIQANALRIALNSITTDQATVSELVAAWVSASHITRVRDHHQTGRVTD